MARASAWGAASSGQDVQSAQNDEASLLPEPCRQFISAPGKGEVGSDTDDLWQGIGGQITKQQIFVPVMNVPSVRRGGGDAG